jgi:hypothetical protein
MIGKDPFGASMLLSIVAFDQVGANQLLDFEHRMLSEYERTSKLDLEVTEAAASKMTESNHRELEEDGSNYGDLDLDLDLGNLADLDLGNFGDLFQDNVADYTDLILDNLADFDLDNYADLDLDNYVDFDLYYEPYDPTGRYSPARTRADEFARVLDLNGDSQITEDELYTSCYSMDFDLDGYLSIEEFFYGNEVMQQQTRICQNLDFMNYFLDELYDPDFRYWGQPEDDQGGLDILDELLMTQELRDAWIENFEDVWSWEQIAAYARESNSISSDSKRSPKQETSGGKKEHKGRALQIFNRFQGD